MYSLMKAVDKASGYVFHCEEGRDTLMAMLSTATRADFDFSRCVCLCMCMYFYMHI